MSTYVVAQALIVYGVVLEQRLGRHPAGRHALEGARLDYPVAQPERADLLQQCLPGWEPETRTFYLNSIITSPF